MEIILVFAALIAGGYSVSHGKTIIPGVNWQCTQSQVTKETLPREEECVQWTRKGKE